MGSQVWGCPSCTYLNPPAYLACTVCRTERPVTGLSGGTDSELAPGSCGDGEDSEVELVEASWSGSTLHSAACSPDTGPAAATAPAAAARSSGCTTGRAANHHNNTGEGAGSCACAYCGGVIPDPFDRWYCADCCPSGPAAPWFACAGCALGRLLEAGGEAAIAAAWAGALPGPKRRPPPDAPDRPTTCYSSTHTLLPIAPLDRQSRDDWRVTLRPGPAQGRRERVARFLRDYPPERAPPSVSFIQVRGEVSEVEARAEAEAARAAPSRSFEEREGAARTAWEVAKAEGRANQERVLDIGRKQGLLTGKWMLRPPSGTGADVWRAVVEAVVCEGLGCSAKTGAGPTRSPAIYIYTPNFDDEADVCSVQGRLGELLAAAAGERKPLKIYYKPDIFVHLRCYARRDQHNPQNIRTSIYNATLTPPSQPLLCGGSGSAGVAAPGVPAAAGAAPTGQGVGGKRRCALACTCRRLAARAAASAEHWATLAAELFTPDQIVLIAGWPRLCHAAALRLEFYGGGEDENGRASDHMFADPIARLLRAAGTACTGITHLEVAADGGMRMLPVRVFSSWLQLPALQSLTLRGPLALNLDLQHLGALTELRLGSAHSAGLKKQRAALPPSLRVLSLAAKDGLPQAVTRCTALRALSVGSAFGVAANSVLKKLTLLTALEIGEQLPSSQQGTLAGLTQLERLGLTGELDSFKTLLPLQRLSLLVLNECDGLAAVPAELSRMSSLKALALNGSSVARFRGRPTDLAVEDLTLALDSAACCSSQLCALPALRTLRLHHACGGWLEHATADRLADVLAAAARAPAVDRVMLCWALGSTVQRFADLQEAIRELGRGANPVRVQQLGVMEHVVPHVV